MNCVIMARVNRKKITPILYNNFLRDIDILFKNYDIKYRILKI